MAKKKTEAIPVLRLKVIWPGEISVCGNKRQPGEEFDQPLVPGEWPDGNEQEIMNLLQNKYVQEMPR